MITPPVVGLVMTRDMREMMRAFLVTPHLSGGQIGTEKSGDVKILYQQLA